MGPVRSKMYVLVHVYVLFIFLFLENQVVRCCLEHAASVARTFLTSDAVVVDIKEPEPIPAGNPMDNSGFCNSNISFSARLFKFFCSIGSFNVCCCL